MNEGLNSQNTEFNFKLFQELQLACIKIWEQLSPSRQTSHLYSNMDQKAPTVNNER